MVKKQLKDITKCVRMTQDTYDFIMTFEGKGFNQKFENACYYFANAKDYLEIDLAELKEEIVKTRGELIDIKRLRRHLDDFDRYFDYCDEIIKSDMPSLLDN